MKSRQLIALMLTCAIAIQPVTANASFFSWENLRSARIQSITNYFDKETINKLIPFSIIASVIGLFGFYYWMTRKTPPKNNADNKSSASSDKSDTVLGQDTQTNDEDQAIDPTLPIPSQLPVYSQANPDGGGGASCGYQTLLRSMQIVAAKANGEPEYELERTLMSQTIIEAYFGSPESEWRKEIIRKRKNDDIKKLLHTKLLLGLNSKNSLERLGYNAETINKSTELYKSSLGTIEDIVLTIVNSPHVEFPYDFTDEAIRMLIKKSVVAPREEKYSDLAQNIRTDEMLNNFFNFDTMRQQLLTNDSVLQLEPVIRDIQNQYESGEWLNDGEMEFLWENNKTTIIPPTAACGFKAISNFSFIGKEGFDEVTPYIEENIRPKLHLKKQFFQIFALGTMRQYSDTGGSYGHWYPLIMHQKADSTRQYFITDSLGDKNRTHDTNALKLISIIEKK